MFVKQNPAFLAASVILIGLVSSANAQVVVSTGVAELYDDNIYLEDELDTPLELTPEPAEGEIPQGQVITKDIDGNPNDDFITNPYIQASGLIPLSSKVRTALDARLGALIFSNESSESRLTVDGTLEITSQKNLIPEPWTVSLRDTIQSTQSSITVSQGNTARSAQTNDASLDIMMAERQIGARTGITAGYTFLRHDFLDEFLFNDSASDKRTSVLGSDYFNNRISSRIRQGISDRWEAFLDNNVEYMAFTNSDSNSQEFENNSDLDRINYHPAAGVNYVPAERFLLSGQVGLDYSYYTEEPTATSRSVLNDDGTITSVLIEPDRNQTSLFFGSEIRWAATDSTLFSLGALQTAGTDIDGQRILTRSFTANASQSIATRLTLVLAGQFVQFEPGDDLGQSTDRFDATAALRLAITDTLALNMGYQYTNQNADQNQLTTTALGSGGDYEANRAFITLDTGFVGLM